MTTAQDNVATSPGDSTTPDAEAARPSIWEDQSVPVGDAPPRSKWSLFFACVMWAGWVVFLIVMMLAARHAAGK